MAAHLDQATRAAPLSPPVDPAAARAVIAPLYDDKRLETGEPLLAHADGLYSIVRGLRDDPDLLAAAYLFGAPDVLRDADDWLRSRFGAAVAQLVADLRVLMRLSQRTRPLSAERGGDAGAQAESLRKMLLALVNDLRVVLLRLASRLQTLRYFATSRHPGAEVFARETLALYAPLANRLGIWQMKWELEDLSFRFLEPETYKRIARQLDEKRVERETFIATAMQELRRMLEEAGISGEVSGRPKHLFSIWKKMQGKGVDLGSIYDLRALRVIVGDVRDCYAALSCVHARWRAVPDQFDDYIAKPKANGYQSLHTVVLD
ncbi:MAG TPA: HD domain-containing protein, partial [Burkholderiaceae bacterium]|nr:HD domain-containing protein [Burkholderiaceae bacterium]